MEKYILLSFYNRGTTVSPSWEVYGHVSEIKNDCLAVFQTQLSAMLYAHSIARMLAIPVIEEMTHNNLIKKVNGKSKWKN